MTTLIQVAVVTLFAASTAQAQQAVQWKVSDGGNGHWYQFVATESDWPSARAIARSRGGELVSITSAAEGQFLRIVCTAPSAWMGASQDASACEPGCGWQWSDGSPWKFQDWDPQSGEPNDGGCCWPSNEDVGEFRSGNGRWNDNLSSVALPSLIEWSADCNADGIIDYGQTLDGQLADANSNNVPDRCECGAFPALPSCCLGDLNADRSVDGADLGTLLFAWGPAVPQSPADLDGDGQVGGADLGLLLFGWGACPVFTPPWATLVEAQPDPAVVTDPSLRSAIAATGLAWRVLDTGTGIEMLLVPPGTFLMGCSPSAEHACFEVENPVHTVSLSGAFYLGRYEVTQEQWISRMGSNPSNFQSSSVDVPPSQVLLRPVERVSWNIVRSFVDASSLRLPTEAEWEYACRAGTTMAFNNGSDIDATVVDIAWFGVNSSNQTRPAGGKAANRLGFHDMHGNVWEWVSDWYSPTYYAQSPLANPSGPPTGAQRVLRGGAWNFASGGLRSSSRNAASPNYVSDPIGFRVARNP